MKKIVFLLLIFFTGNIFAQKEANIWYFGNNSGLDFSNGDPVAITDGQLSTIEGCSTTSDSNGNLLFYTDGQIVFNKNHQVMMNGNSLGGNPSSSQSAIVVPKPNNPDHFYIFTVDEHNSNVNGLQYSIVDMTLDGGLGGIIATDKNVSLLQHCSEKITAVKSDDCDSIWVIAYSNINGIFSNYQAGHTFDTFHAFRVTPTGVNASVTSPTPNSTIDGRGYLKVSADGSKIAIANQNQLGAVHLYDFNVINGVVSNEQVISLNDTINPDNNSTTEAYGIEFSLDASKLYVTSIATANTFNMSPQDGFLWQYNINGFGNNAQLIAFNVNTTYRGALQMGPNGKIYRALSAHYEQGSNFLGVINNPNDLGISCNYQHNAINLGSGISRQGLPPFIQSLFLPNVDIVNDGSGVLVDHLDLCNGESYTLEPELAGFPATTTYEWLFNDVAISPAVTSSSILVDDTNFGTGTYKVKIDFNDGSTCPFFGEAAIDFHPNPILSTPITIKQCDDDTDGFANIDLTLANDKISNNSATETFLYFINQADAENGDVALSIQDPANYNTNSTGANPLWVRVENEFCFTVGEVHIIVSTSSTSFNRIISLCDDYIDSTNDNHDGISEFDLTQFESDLLSIFPAAQQPNLSFTYYLNLNDALLQTNNIASPATYRNVAINTAITPERIFIRVNNNSNIDCVGLGNNLYIDLIVEKLPVAHQPINLRACETVSQSQEGLFDTTSIPASVLQGQLDVSLTYFEEDTTGNLIQIPSATFLNTSYLSSSKIITVKAINNITNDPNGACFNQTTFDLIVDDLPVANPVPDQTLCDDFPDQLDGMSVFDTSAIQSTILQGQLPANMEIHYYNQDGSEILPTLPDMFNTASQLVRVEVININNPTCVATTTISFAIVDDSPVFDVSDQMLCINELPTPLQVSVEDVLGYDYTYEWMDFRGNIIPTLQGDTSVALITKAGEYSVTATSLSMCTTTKIFDITESSIPTIENITIFDDLPSNRISVLVSGIGDYEFALDNVVFVNGNELKGHIFYDVEEGLHTIQVNDKNGCTPMIEVEVVVIRFPKYISPNFDGQHDEFYVYGGDAFKISEVIIFDRFGKVIAVLNDNEKWNGTYLGKTALETDYWFIAKFVDRQGKTYERRGNFSLKL